MALVLTLYGCGGGDSALGPSVDTAAKPPPPPPTPTPCKIAFHKYVVYRPRYDGNQVFTMYTNGTGVTQLTNYGLGQGYNGGASWSGDGTRICFESSRDGFSRIYIMNGDGSAPQRVTPIQSAYDYWPDWSPMGERIAFYRRNYGGPNPDGVYVVDVAGVEPMETRVTGTQTGDICPSWAPAGDWIAFGGSARQGGGVWVIAAAGGQASLLTAPASLPDVSPSGDKVAYRGPGGQIQYIPVDGQGGAAGSPVQVTPPGFPYECYHPTWSPDEAYIVFTAAVPGAKGTTEYHVLKINVQTQEWENIGGGHYPHWSPVLP